MPRRLRPINDATYVTTITKQSETGDTNEIKFYSRKQNLIRQLVEHSLGFRPPREARDLIEWNRAQVSDPAGGSFANEVVSFDWTDGTNTVNISRVLQIEESAQIDTLKVFYFNGDTGLINNYQFSDEQLDQEFTGTVKANLSGPNQWPVTITVENRRLRATLVGLDALDSSRQEPIAQWQLTNDLGSVV